jgi:hypothetical protein
MQIPSWFRFLTPSARLIFPELAQVLLRSRRRPHKGRPALECCLLEDRTAPVVLVAISGDAQAGTWDNSTNNQSALASPPQDLSASASGDGNLATADLSLSLGSARGSITGNASLSVSDPNAVCASILKSSSGTVLSNTPGSLNLEVQPEAGSSEQNGDPVAIVFSLSASIQAQVPHYPAAVTASFDTASVNLNLTTETGNLSDQKSDTIKTSIGSQFTLGFLIQLPQLEGTASENAQFTLSYQVQDQPTLRTTASPAITLGTTAQTVSDTADLEGGSNETGNIVFTLTGPGGFSYTQTDPVSGNGTYDASTPLATTGTVAGTYTWSASYSGDSNNPPASDNGANETTVVSPAQPTLTTTAGPDIALDTTAPTISDSADLAGGYYETGSIVFTLSGPGGFSYTETEPVNGDGTYSASTPLPITGAVAGTYTWSASYSGDDNNLTASDDGANERTVVSPAQPTLTTTASPDLTLGATAPTINDAADLQGGYYETGSIVFTLSGPGGFSYSQTDPVNGDGTYSASTQLPTTGRVAGTYTWSATYSGDANNLTASDDGASETTVVSPAQPTLTTTASPDLTLGATAPIISDSADLQGGYYETGSLVFTLSGSGGFSYTQTDPVNGNGTYSASALLPTTGTVAGTYTWSAAYSGDANNLTATDDGANETTVVSPAQPTLTTTASQNITLGTTAPTISDSANLKGGYYETGSIVFTLRLGTTTVYSTSDTLTGNGTYTASYTLPTAGAVTGTYTWSVSYLGDGNNNGVADQGGTAEQTLVAPASPVITTTPSPTTVTLSSTAPAPLNDAAVLTGGYSPTGTIAFTLTYNSVVVYTDHVTVSGDNTYSTSQGDHAGGYTLPGTGTVVGAYQWAASYGGDSNNRTAHDQGGAAEQVTVGTAPSITSANGATFTVGVAGAFTVTTSPGFPTATTLSDSGVLPRNVSFTDNRNGTATLSGTPAPSTGVYMITLTAANAIGSTSQVFALTVIDPPRITSANATTFKVGKSGSFTVRTSRGLPLKMTLSESDALPAGISFNAAANGTATLSGKPAAYTGGVYVLTIIASNGAVPNAVQTFTLTVSGPAAQAPTITSGSSTTFAVGVAGSFTITASPGIPSKTTLTENGPLPQGVVFTAGLNNTAKLTGTPKANTGGTYAITITAANGIVKTTQAFTLTVSGPAAPPPTFTSANSTTFTAGTAGTFAVTTNPGVPAKTTLSEKGALPAGVSFTAGTGGTARLSGKPQANTGGAYIITLIATNGLAQSIQTFTLTVDRPPAITSPLQTGLARFRQSSFTVTTSGFPYPKLTLASTDILPAGVSFVDNGNGTATLSGTPTAGQGAFFDTLNITAGNGVGASVTQMFTLVIGQSPIFTSLNTATFSTAQAGSFTITTSAAPAVTLTESGALPTGITFHDNGDGTARLSGKPAAGSRGTYTFVVTASSRAFPSVFQLFILTIT